MLEGKNGIGKTVAVQLLQLISGSIPEDFNTHPALWSSLRERLGATSVFLDHLKDGQSITFTFTPESWPEELPGALGDWVGTPVIDGRKAAYQQCTSLLSVVRMSGDEDLEVTLRRRVDTLTNYFKEAAKRVRQRGDQIERRVSDIADDLDRADPDEIKRDQELLAETERQLDGARRTSTAADLRLRHLLSAIENQRRIDAAGQEAATLLERRVQLLSQINNLNGQLSEQTRRAEDADAALAEEGDAQRKVAEAEGLLRRRRTRLANLQRGVETTATELHFPKTVTPAEVQQAVTQSEDQIAQLTLRYRELDSTSLVRDLIKGLTIPLTAAVDDIGQQILVRTEEASLTVSQTLDGVNARDRELVDQPQPARLRELAAQIDLERQRLNGLRDLQEDLNQQNQQTVRVRQAEQEAEAAIAQAAQASENARRSREANQAVGATQAALTETHFQLAVIQQQIGSTGATSREDAEADLGAALRELGVGIEQLAEAEQLARTALAQADLVLSERETTASAIRRRLTLRRTGVDLVIDRLRGDARYQWLWESIPGLAAGLQDPDRKYDTFAKFRKAFLYSSESAYEAANLLSSLAGIAQSFFDSDRDAKDGSGDLIQDLRPGFQAVLGQRLRDALNSDSIRKAIFDGAEVINVEPATRQLTLQNGDGVKSQRSMEAFSSGERAFAFTQARIADLEPSSKPNRLLILDEFGAYVSADRLPDLASFLAGYVDNFVDQVIVILPLHVDYAAEINETRGELRARYEERLSQIRQRGYCAVELA